MASPAGYALAFAALIAAGAAWWYPAREPARATPIRDAVSAAIEQRIGHPWRVRTLHVRAPVPADAEGSYLVDVEVELAEPTFTALELVEGATLATAVGSPGYSKRLFGRLWLDEGNAAAPVRLHIDNMATLDRMGTPLSRIPGRVIARDSFEFERWSAAPQATAGAGDSACLGRCPLDRLGHVENQEGDQRREEQAEHEGADETATAAAADEADDYR
ncbi:hypothetical protein IGS68_31740 (plasmid) [Skermanella sp. TT6]|uniref:Uncharacterized protein n=1 Tax=Skermanella cutis TaxID=2775420 RepID=A0ABX7BHC1_9PROT|nr:hypothetical protein [Skermanella sp. TT6]QQP93598.1 hypothetical protein IGS68_31740 [Skermanella sp. TT6]